MRIPEGGPGRGCCLRPVQKPPRPAPSGCVSGRTPLHTDADPLRPEAQPGAHVRGHPGDHHRHQPERGQQRGGDVRGAALPLPQVTRRRAGCGVRGTECRGAAPAAAGSG